MPAHHQSSILLRRQVLYLLRSSFFNSLLGPILSFVLTSSVVILFRDSEPVLLSFLVMLGAVFTVGLWVEPLALAAGVAHRCAYYWFSRADLLRANLVLLLLPTTLFFTLYTIYQLTASPEGLLLSAGRILTVGFSLILMIYVLAYRLSEELLTSRGLGGLLLAATLILTGIGIHYYGAALPLAGIVIMWLMQRSYQSGAAGMSR